LYGLVHDDFSPRRLNGLQPVRPGASPLTKTTLAQLVDLSRGDLVDTSQARIHAKMRTVMSMGRSDESQRLAMHLLRRAQASKGIFNINALFKEFVLTEPLAITRWGRRSSRTRRPPSCTTNSRTHANASRRSSGSRTSQISTAPPARTTS
jgi:hypothetical protein